MLRIIGLIRLHSLHEGLKSKALAAGVKIDLQSPIRSVDAEEASITLENGKTVKGDAVIGADGIHVSDPQKYRFIDIKPCRYLQDGLRTQLTYCNSPTVKCSQSHRYSSHKPLSPSASQHSDS